MPLQRRLPKRGFRNIFKKQYSVINLRTLEGLSDTSITPESLLEQGVVKNIKDGIKILGNGEIKKPLNVKAHAFSSSAKEKILKAGGKVEVI